MMVEVHSSKELKMVEEETDVKGEVKVGVMVEGGGMVEGEVMVKVGGMGEGEVMVEGGAVVEAGVIVKRQVKVEATLAALAVTMMIGKAIQELMSSLLRESWLHL